MEKIESVGQLEVLLLLFNHPEKRWDATAVSTSLQSNADSAAKQLKRLHETGLIVVEQGSKPLYWYKPSNDEVGLAVSGLAMRYPVMRHRFISMIYDKPREQIKAFVDSFKIGGGGDDNG